MFTLPLVALLVQALSGAPLDALQAPAGTKAIVFLFTSTDCPISNRYAPELQRIYRGFSVKNVKFWKIAFWCLYKTICLMKRYTRLYWI